MTPCTICGSLIDTTPAAEGLLYCCARCTPQATPCDPGPHDWHGSARPGTWICWKCPARIESQSSGEQPRDIPPSPALNYDPC